jgi:putative nucleotidyltransferase with HDIG domain
MRADGSLGSVWIVVGFWVAASVIALLRENVVEYRPGQWAPHNIVSRVDFGFTDWDRFTQAQERARETAPRVYRATGDAWGELEQFLLSLPDRVAGSTLSQLSPELQSHLDNTALAKLQESAASERRGAWTEMVRQYTSKIRALKLVILPDEQRRQEVGRTIAIAGAGASSGDGVYSPAAGKMREEISAKINKLAADEFPLMLGEPILALTLERIKPTHSLDETATAQARAAAASGVPESEARVSYAADQIIASRGEITPKIYQVLKAENEAFLKSLGARRVWARVGLVGCVGILTVALAGYVARFQPRVVRNHARGIGIAALLASTLLLAQLAAVGSSPLYVFGVAPTILVAMILAIAYDQRFAVGVGSIHAALVTLALGAPLSFLLILWSGVVTCCFLLDDVRTRSKLIEVGGATALAMIGATITAGLLGFHPIEHIVRSCLYVGAAGLAVGFVVLGILPFIESFFRITTSMTLLELADVSHPLLRRLALEAPGTYNHSLQVATLAEEAAEAIGANGLLCRVASYFHDVGKIIKPDYFVENQAGGVSRHLNLDPNLSLLIIIGHVKDGLELAREYNLPTSLFPFIQQHHGTTLVEYFYHRACTQQEQRDAGGRSVSDTEFRYKGPKPKSREIAVVMLADCIESATRSMTEPTAGRIEALVHDLAMKRMSDGQFDECDLTMRDLERIERALVKTLLGIYHGRIAYPSTMSITQPQPPQQPAEARTA